MSVSEVILDVVVIVASIFSPITPAAGATPLVEPSTFEALMAKGSCAPSAALSIEKVMEADVALVIVGRVIEITPLVSLMVAARGLPVPTILDAGKAAEIS